MKRTVVFISLPMSGRSEEDILIDIEQAKKTYLTMNQKDITEVAFVNNYECGARSMAVEKEDARKIGAEFIEPDHLSVWYLGIALNNIAYCDEVFFYKGWENARGCRIEYEVCEKYDIPMTIYKTI